MGRRDELFGECECHVKIKSLARPCDGNNDKLNNKGLVVRN